MNKSISICLIIFALSASICSHEARAGVECGTLQTSDNITIAYDHYRNGRDSCIIICPGYYNSKQNHWMKKTAELLSPAYDVILFDFRGHGKSGGTFTWSAREYLDAESVSNYVKAQRYRRIGIIGFSMGAAAAINAAVTSGGIDSMILISCPSKFSSINFHFWEPGMLSDLFDNISCGWEGKGARAGNIFLAKRDAIDAITKLNNIPILFIHGSNDWVVKDRHSKRLYEAYNGKKKLVLIKGGLHAERLIQSDPEEMQKLMLNWFSDTLK